MGVNIYAENENIGLFDALSSKTRLEIIRLLSKNPQNIMQLAESIGVSTAVVSRHVDLLVKNGVVISEFTTSQRGRQRICRLKEESITVYLKSAKDSKMHTMCMRIGDYDKCIDVQAPCGLSNDTEIRGVPDDPRYFMMPFRKELTHIWFSNGVLKYIVSEPIKGTEINSVTVKFVMSAICHNDDSKHGMVYLSFCEKIFCDISVNPEMHAREYVVKLDKSGVWLDGKIVSNVGIDNYRFDMSNFSFEIGAGYKNGVKTVLHIFSKPDMGDIELMVDVN